jgi:dolichol-phosphate mannosyltransferase
MADKLLSIVLPCFDEEAVLPETHRRISGCLERLDGVAAEILYVDDGSSDMTATILDELARTDPRVRVLHLSRNFGHQMAITAGIEHAAGDAVVVMDADLQDPPELLAELVARWREGYHVVYGVRSARGDDTRFKRTTARGFYRLLNRLSDTPIPSDVGDFRLMDRAVVDAFLSMPERDRFVRGMVAWLGFRQAAVPYARPERPAGTTKYPFARMARFAADALVSFSLAPLRFATVLGFVASLVAVAGIVWALVVYAIGDTVQGWTTILVAVLFLGGVQLLALGIIGEYLGRVYREAKRRPLYVVERRVGFGGESEAAAPPVREPDAARR